MELSYYKSLDSSHHQDQITIIHVQHIDPQSYINIYHVF